VAFCGGVEIAGDDSGYYGAGFGIILALGLMAVGIVLTMTVAGAPVGIPVAVLGFLLMIRSVF